MKTAKLALVIFAVAAAAAACGNSAGPDSSANARPTATVVPAPGAPAPAGAEFGNARADYSQFCINCHKADGTGGPFELEGGKSLQVPSLRERGLRDTDEELAEQIHDGGDGMPAFKTRLDERRVADLVRFIRREFHGR